MLGRFFIFCIRTIRPALGPSSCRFCVSCTDYAIERFQVEPFYKAFPKSALRVLLCMPFTPARWITWFESTY